MHRFLYTLYCKVDTFRRNPLPGLELEDLYTLHCKVQESLHWIFGPRYPITYLTTSVILYTSVQSSVNRGRVLPAKDLRFRQARQNRRKALESKNLESLIFALRRLECPQNDLLGFPMILPFFP